MLFRIHRPVELPFAGRVGSTLDLFRVLHGEGSIREEQCVVWRVFSELIACDLVGGMRRDDSLEIAERAGFNLYHLEGWLTDAANHARARTGWDTAWNQVNPRDDFMRMDWHAIRKLQDDTRLIYSSMHQRQRYWSLGTRAEHLASGGSFSRFETRLSGPLGPGRLPWVDARRFAKPNPVSPVVQDAERSRVPMVTGVSGVSMHMHQFARVLGVDDPIGVRLVAAAYLLPIRQHSFYEILVSEGSAAPDRVEPLVYRDLVPIDHERLHIHSVSKV
ncbi:hypothetical protein [Luteibacter sp.]|uniref:hypothetical protein n=1 Tax=Luteibacter sp. TaxID=1886636 RepID=UPI002F3F1BD3